MKMSSQIGRLMCAYLLTVSCFTFVCVHGGRPDDPPSCEVSLNAWRNTVLKTAPQQSLTIRCPVRHCGESLQVTWCKLSTDRCDQLKNTENVEISQNITHEDVLISYLTFKWISIHDAGLYRCGARRFKNVLISHFINVSVSDAHQGFGNMYNDGAVRSFSFKEGSDVNLTCSDRTWNQRIFVTWEIVLKNKSCRVAFKSDGQSLDTCNDGKTFRNTSSSQSYLHIPKFSNGDDGVYKCQLVYDGGSTSVIINLDIIVPPSVSTWLEQQGNKVMAVCKAERGKPAASISWSHARNSSLVETLDSDGLFTAESRLLLPGGRGDLSCVIRHPYWEEEKIFIPEIREGVHPWFYIHLVLGIALILSGLSVLVMKLKRRCQQSDP